jgi:hypothetical protein
MFKGKGESIVNVIDFENVRAIRNTAIYNIENNVICLVLQIPVKEISFWIQALTFSTHATGYLLQNEKVEREQRLLAKEYSVLQDLTQKMLVFNGYEKHEKTAVIGFTLNYEETIIVESQLERYLNACNQYNDSEYSVLTSKYLNTIYKIMDEQAEAFDQMTKYLIKKTVGKK